MALSAFILTKANDFEPYDPSSTIEGGTEWLRKAQGREIIVSLIHESEALSKKHNIASLKDSQVFAYIAVRAAGEDTFAEYIDPDISLELYKSPMFGAAFGIKWLELVDEFVVNMGASIPKEFKTYYNTTRANIRPEIERRVRHRTSPITTYKEMVRVANELWIYLVTQSQTPASLESSVEEDPQAMTNKSISLRLGNLKRLFDNKEITELEYQRQRQRILGDL